MPNIEHVAVKGVTYDVASSGGGAGQNVWYGTCTASASTAAKTVTSTSGDFELTTGNSVLVRFSNGNTSASATLNIDNTGAIDIRRNGTTNSSQYMWGAGEIVHFVYDGTYFLIVEGYRASTDYYGVTRLNNSTSSTSETEAATPLAVKTVADSIPTSTSDLTNDSGFITLNDIPPANGVSF